MKVNPKCPHCGKFISGDVMEKLDLQATIKKLEKDLAAAKKYSIDYAKEKVGNEKIKNERDALLKANTLMEEELGRMRAYEEDLERRHRELTEKMFRLENRSLWKRIFNK